MSGRSGVVREPARALANGWDGRRAGRGGQALTAGADGERGQRLPPSAVPADWPNRESSFFLSDNGRRWHVQRQGTGPTLALVHGTGASTHSWGGLLPLLARDFDVIAMDLPGHGYSAAGPMDLPSLAAAVGDVVERLDARPVLVAGHSAGAAIALRAVLDGRLEPRAVVGINAALRPYGGALGGALRGVAGLFASTGLVASLLARRAADPRAIDRLIRGTGSALSTDGVRWYQRLFQKPGHVRAVLTMMAGWDLRPLRTELPSLSIPLWLLTGDRDRAVPPGEARALAAGSPRIHCSTLAGLGHLAHEEDPARVADEIRRIDASVRGDHADG